ncbi:MAG: hypothetical protein HY369_01255 [Candidatus Aenigmarchaeota archaeon]|nr:hypothetical protein [Candidatus Aenigmarchaeota archaeon]
MKTKEARSATPLVARLRAYMAERGLRSAAALAAALNAGSRTSIPYSTVHSWVVRGREPRRRDHRAVIERLLSSKRGPPSAAPPGVQRRARVVADQVALLLPLLAWFARHPDPTTRRLLRDEMGAEDHERFVTLARALNNELVLDKAREEDPSLRPETEAS